MKIAHDAQQFIYAAARRGPGAAPRAKKEASRGTATTGFYYSVSVSLMKSSSARLMIELGVVPAAAAAALIRSA